VLLLLLRNVKNKALLHLQNEMSKASAALEFERCIELQKQIDAIKSVC